MHKATRQSLAPTAGRQRCLKHFPSFPRLRSGLPMGATAGIRYTGTHTRHFSPPPSGCELSKGGAIPSLLGDVVANIHSPAWLQAQCQVHQILTTHLDKRAPAARCHGGRVRGTVRANCRQQPLVASPPGESDLAMECQLFFQN